MAERVSGDATLGIELAQIALDGGRLSSRFHALLEVAMNVLEDETATRYARQRAFEALQDAGDCWNVVVAAPARVAEEVE